MVISILIFAVFFSVNDSIMTFKNSRFRIISENDSQIKLMYRGKIEAYETGNYYYPRFLIKEINVKKLKNGALIKIKLRKRRSVNKHGNIIIFKTPETPFFIKLSGANRESVKKLLLKAGLNYSWLDSLTDMDYTIYGVFTEKTLKRELLNNGRNKKTDTLKKR